MNAIVVVDQDWGISKEGQLLIHLPGDLKYFKEKTLGKTVVMGRETLETLPGGRPLPGRENIVLTRNKGYDVQCPLCHSVDELLQVAKDNEASEYYIIGGEQIYREFLPYCTRIYVTKIEARFGADKFFENLEENPAFQKVMESEPVLENGVRYRFVEYRRK